MRRRPAAPPAVAVAAGPAAPQAVSGGAVAASMSYGRAHGGGGDREGDTRGGGDFEKLLEAIDAVFQVDGGGDSSIKQIQGYSSSSRCTRPPTSFASIPTES